MHLIDDGGMTFAGHIAFMTLFSLFPFLIFLTTLAGRVRPDRRRARVRRDGARTACPHEVSEAIRPAIDQVINDRRTGLMTVSILASLWAVSSGIEALREALNKAYGVEEPRSIWFCRLQSLLFTIIFSIGILVVMLVMVIGPVVWSFIAPRLELDLQWGWFYEAARYVLAVSLLYLVVALLYRWLPSRHLPRREILPGAAVTVVLWMLLASLFSLYLQNLGALLGDLRQPRRHRAHADVLLHLRPDLHLRRRDQQRAAPRRSRPPARGARPAGTRRRLANRLDHR